MAYKDAIIDPGSPWKGIQGIWITLGTDEAYGGKVLWSQQRHLWRGRRTGGGAGRMDVLISAVSMEGALGNAEEQ